ncbi:FAD:protein FMN transferase [Ideonella sp.]|uniref:FAD:protein FMN transferase n=1 Tax=Ideonella sp. TaxID=1929293 RepID=UPI0035ADA3AF
MRAPDSTRRALLGALAGASAAWLTAPALAGPAPALRDRRALMGTWVDLTLDGAPAATLAAARDAAWAEMERLAAMMSRYVPGNPLDRVQQAAGREPVAVPREMLRVMQAAQALAKSTQGAFDITVGALGWQFDETQRFKLPTARQIQSELRFVNYRDLVLNHCECSAWLKRAGMKLDLGGVAKLPILAAGLAAAVQAGAPAAMVNGGGDVLVRSAPGGREWRIGIRDPLAPDRLLAVLPLRQGVVASSGDYERGVTLDGRRWHHVLDPATGYPTAGVRGVTLVGEGVDAVNGLGTAAMVMGPQRGADLLAGTPARQALLVRADGGLWASPGLAARLQPPPGARRVRGLA